MAGVLLALGAILFMARGALFPFIISLVLAELLYPAVKFLETRLPGHRRAPTVTRVVSIMAIYIVFAGCLVGVAYLTIPPLFAEAQHFIRTFPEFYERARTTVEGWSENLTAQIPQDFLVHIEGAVASGGDVLAEAAQGVITRTLSGASSTLTIVIGLAIVPFLLFYLLKDREEITSGMYASMSPRSAMHLRNVLNVLSRVIGAYVRAQILSACIVGALVFIGLSILGIEFAATLGLVAGLFGLIPIIGPFLGAVPGILVTLSHSPDKLIWVALVYVVVQLVENNLISPRIHGRAVRLHPVLIMAILVVGSEIAGLWGVVVAVPVTAAARDVVIYFHRAWGSDNVASIDTVTAPEDDSKQPMVEPSNTAEE